MCMHKDSEYGRLSVHNEILAQLASVAVAQVPGVVNLVPRVRTPERSHDLIPTREPASNGVWISVDSQGLVVIDISIAVRYGVKIKDVGLEVVKAVEQIMWDAVSVRPHRVVVHVEGVRKL